MEKISHRQITEFEISLFLDRKIVYPKELTIPFSFCGKIYNYEFSLNSESDSSTYIHITFIYKSTFLCSDSIKLRKNYLNSKIELGWFNLLPESLNYDHRIVFNSNMQQESRSKILCYTVQKMNFIFQTYLPIFLYKQEILTQSSIKSLCENFQKLKKKSSTSFELEVKYVRNNEKSDPVYYKEERLKRFSKDINILEKIVKNEELFEFFIPFAKIDFIEKRIKCSQFLPNIRKVSVNELSDPVIQKKLENIFKLLNNIQMHVDVKIILGNLFQSQGTHYFVLIKKPIYRYILEKAKDIITYSKSINKFIPSYSDMTSLSKDHIFQNLSTFAFIGKDSNMIELPRHFLGRYLKFKSINSKNLITIHGLIKDDSSKYYIVTENFIRNSYYEYFFSLNYENNIHNEISKSILTEFKNTILDLSNLIYMCNIKGLGLIDLSSEYLYFSSGVVKLIPSFEAPSNDVLSPEEKLSMENFRRGNFDANKPNILASNIYRLGLLIFNILFKNFYQKLFNISDIDGLIENLLNGEPPEIDKDLNEKYFLFQVVKNLLEKDINERVDPKYIEILLNTC